MSDAELPDNHTGGIDVSTPSFYPGTFTSSNALGLMNPDSMLGGTLRSTQFVGSNTLQIDSTQNLISIKNSSAALNQTGVLRIGQVASSYLGMAVNNGTVDTMFAGQDSSGNTVIKIAKSGFDAKTATNDQLVFNSSQNVFKIAKKIVTQTSSYSQGSGQVNYTLLTIPHGLSFIPIAQVYVQGQIFAFSGAGIIASSFIPLPIITNSSANANNYYFPSVTGANSYFMNIVFGIDATNIYVQVSSISTSSSDTIASIPVSIFLLQETAT